MPKFRKKPVEIEAIQLTWSNWSAVCEFVPRPWFERGCYVDDNGEEVAVASGRIGLLLNTLESNKVTGSLMAVQDDWIIRGVAGEFYPCKPGIFAATYEPAEDPKLERVLVAVEGRAVTCDNVQSASAP